jgi:hypothetical protein
MRYIISIVTITVAIVQPTSTQKRSVYLPLLEDEELEDMRAI